MIGTDRDHAVAAVRSGIEAVIQAAGNASGTDPTPCEAWTVHDLVRHLEAIAGAYVLWTGGSIGGRTAALRVGDDLAAYNDRIMRRLPRLSTEEHLRRYRDAALDHLRLAEVTWDMPMLRTPAGVVLHVGQHAAVAAVEWHVHAWDLAWAGGEPYRPHDHTLQVLVRAWDDMLSDVTGEIRERLGDPWTSLLRATGRTP